VPDLLIGEVIQTYLKDEKFNVEWLKRKIEIDVVLHLDVSFNLIILDLNIPGWSWKQWIPIFKKKHPKIPILVVSATNTISDALTIGADAFLQKNLLNQKSLISHVQALLRRSVQTINHVITYKNISLNINSREVRLNGKLVALSRREFALLNSLLTNIDKIVERKYLIKSLYGWQKQFDSNTLEAHICNLRRKLKANYIKTVRGAGYIIQKT
jgi:two-component system, OmpR family, response regulator QseB